jgi:hypothetical protein
MSGPVSRPAVSRDTPLFVGAVSVLRAPEARGAEPGLCPAVASAPLELDGALRSPVAGRVDVSPESVLRLAGMASVVRPVDAVDVRRSTEPPSSTTDSLILDDGGAAVDDVLDWAGVGAPLRAGPDADPLAASSRARLRI